ncbi:hypothetical protein VTK56DRAFT_8353 [Thermocarpiscus australiensis]
MAVALGKSIWAIGLRTAALLQSLFLSPFDALLHAVKLLSKPGRTNQPTLPCSAPADSASSAPGQLHKNIDVGVDVAYGIDSDSDGYGSGNMATASSLSAVSALQGRKTSVFENGSTSSTAPAKKENRPAPTGCPADVNTRLLDGFSRLDINDAGKTAAPRLASHHIVANGTENGLENGKGLMRVVQNGARSQRSDSDGGSSSTAGEVTRAPPVPLTHSVSQTSRLKETATIQMGREAVQLEAKVETPEQAAERAMHSRFMREALDMARLALRTNETPVGCVLVYRGRVIAKGMNATNVTRNGTRHAELMAVCALLSFTSSSDLETVKSGSRENAATARMPLGDRTNQEYPTETSTWGDVDPRDGHLYPYGQKLHPSPRVDPSIVKECTLYVTVEPCVMCASLLRQLGIKKVYFGAVNDKFGGTGGVFRIHKNSPYSMTSAPAPPALRNGQRLARSAAEKRPSSSGGMLDGEVSSGDDESEDEVGPVDPALLPGDGGNVEPGYEVEGGWGRDEAVNLLRQFYVQENNRAPVPRKKEGRAARLAAMMERAGLAGGSASDASAVPTTQENTEADTPETQSSSAEDAADSVTA